MLIIQIIQNRLLTFNLKNIRRSFIPYIILIPTELVLIVQLTDNWKLYHSINN